MNKALNKVGILFALVGLLAGLPSASEAQIKDGKELVKASLLTDRTLIQPNERFRVGVLYQMAPGWHIYWANPGDSGLPPKIDWRFPPGFKVGPTQWPLPVRDKEPGDLEVFTYAEQVLLFAEVQAPPQVPAGPLEIRAKSEWLVCERSCVPGQGELSLTVNNGAAALPQSEELFRAFSGEAPTSLPASLKVNFRRSGKNVEVLVDGAPKGTSLDFFPLPPEGVVLGHAEQEQNKVVFSIDTEPQPLKTLDGVLVIGQGVGRRGYAVQGSFVSGLSSAAIETSGAVVGLVQALFFSLIGGLILNVMPCVLPVISLKVFGFINEAHGDRRRVIRLALAFAAGIMSCFALLALVVIGLRTAGVRVGWGFQFQDPRFLLAIIAVVFAFALNLFGVYELTVSAGSTRGLAQLASGTGLGAAFFQGVFATILATPCTAPFLGTAAAFAFAQPALLTFLVFLVIGLGMSLPYLALAARPGWMRFVPRPGAWMIHLKQVLGFLLLATLLWLLWVLGQLQGLNAVIGACGLLLVIAILAWIKGSFWTPVASIRMRRIAALAMLAVLALAGSSYAFVTRPEQLAWEPFNQENLAKAISSGHPVFVDFTADWCLTCKSNERFAIDTAPVRAAFAKKNVVALRADWTHGDPAITEILKEHGRVGVPTYLVYPGGSEKPPILLPELITSESVLKALDKT
jgi:thiol:disulfide interchange protein